MPKQLSHHLGLVSRLVIQDSSSESTIKNCLQFVSALVHSLEVDTWIVDLVVMVSNLLSPLFNQFAQFVPGVVVCHCRMPVSVF